MNPHLEEEIRQFAIQQNQNPETYRLLMEAKANHLHNVMIERIALQYNLPRTFKDFEEEQNYYIKANKILIQQIRDGEFIAETPEEQFLQRIALDIAEECCQTPPTVS